MAAADSESGVARIAVTVRNEGYYEADGRSRKNVQQSVLQWLLYVIWYRPHAFVRSYRDTGTVLTISKRERGASVLKRE